MPSKDIDIIDATSVSAAPIAPKFMISSVLKRLQGAEHGLSDGADLPDRLQEGRGKGLRSGKCRHG